MLTPSRSEPGVPLFNFRRVVPAGVLALVLGGCDGSPTAPTIVTLPPIQTPPIPAGVSVVIASMLSRTAANIVYFHRENQELLPRNPSLATYINDKIAMLSSPTLINDIFNGRRWAEGTAPTPIGDATRIGAVFPLEAMREPCARAIREIEGYLLPLVEFFGEPFPFDRLELWYGFTIGATGGNGAIAIVDEAVSLRRYASRISSCTSTQAAVRFSALAGSHCGVRCPGAS